MVPNFEKLINASESARKAVRRFYWSLVEECEFKHVNGDLRILDGFLEYFNAFTLFCIKKQWNDTPRGLHLAEMPCKGHLLGGLHRFLKKGPLLCTVYHPSMRIFLVNSKNILM